MESKIREWLQTQGYPLEMKVARLFRAHLFNVLQSDYYEDSETGIQRETDVIAAIDCDCGGVMARILFVVECKSSPNKPWVLFSGGRRLADPARVVQSAGSDLGRRVLSHLCQRHEIQALAQFRIDEPAGYGITQAFTSGNDVPYLAATSVSKAGAAETKKADNFWIEYGHPVCLFVFPVIVIDAEFVEAHLEVNGDVAVNRISSGTLVWRNRLIGKPHTIIRVMRIEEVEQFANEMYMSCKTFLDLASETIQGSRQLPRG